MPTDKNFAKNFRKLKEKNIIPDIDENHLSKNMRDAINGLSAKEIDVLEKICARTKSSLFLHSDDGGGIVAL